MGYVWIPKATELVDFANACNRLFVLSAPDVDPERRRIAEAAYDKALNRLVAAGYSPSGVDVDLAFDYVRAQG